MIKPTATACIEMSPGIPNIEHAMGINRREPPATPDAPQAANVESKLNNSPYLGILTLLLLPECEAEQVPSG